MKNDINEIIYIALAFIIVYGITNDLIIAIAMMFIVAIYGILFLFKKLKQKKLKITIMREQNAFISSFIVSLSVSNSLEYALNAAIEHASKTLKEELQLTKEGDVLLQLQNLEAYFDTVQFSVFINLINIYQEAGGSILKISEHFLPVIKRLQLCVDETEALSKRKILEFTTLWGFSFAIIAFCRLGLSDFYSQISHNVIFRALLAVLFLFFMLSFHLAMKNYLYIEFLGDKERG